MAALVHFECIASLRGNSTLYTIHTLPSSSTVSWHGLYKPLDLHEGERRTKLQSLLLLLQNIIVKPISEANNRVLFEVLYKNICLQRMWMTPQSSPYLNALLNNIHFVNYIEG